jgi:isopenicillin N synthase-like dioxygenase
MASQRLSSYPQSTWDTTACDLRDNCGVALIELTDEVLQEISKRAFQTTLVSFPCLQNDISLHIPSTADSAHATGYHGASDRSSMSRYNRYREGLVFSDGTQLLDEIVECTNGNTKEYSNLFKDCAALEDLLHSVAEYAMHGIERILKLPENWFFNNFGPTRTSSQWHIKRYHMAKRDAVDNKEEEDRQNELLPTHTDPSIISVIIHDREGKQAGCQGLKFSKEGANGRDWIEVPYSGHGVAVVLVGSLLSHITGGYFPACRHSVSLTQPLEHRMAATLFLRPVGRARMIAPPSHMLQHVVLKRDNLTFEEWNMRVSKNYMKSKKNTSKNESEKLVET